LQRKIGWDKAVDAGYAWNKGERQVGNIRRIPLDDLPVGLPKDAPISALTPETAGRRAIVLLPKTLNAKQDVEYVVFLHGHTESSTSRPFAGWRAYQPPPLPKGAKPPPPKKPEDESAAERLRHGIDDKDVAPVRDVALDQAEAQLEDSGLTQVVIVLVQGGLTSQFGDAGDKNFDAGNYVDKIAARLLTEGCWLDANGTPVTDHAPKLKRVTMAGHSGAGATLAHMADAKQPSSALTGDLVIYDAINRGQLSSFVTWAGKRLDADLAVLTGTATDDQKFE
jgi:hypothetical protein